MSETIAAIATGSAAGGIGVIRISGDSAIEVAQKVFRSVDSAPLSSLAGYTAKFGRVYKDGEAFDQAVALVFRAPKSYTGEDVVELSVHGGIYVVEKTLEAVFDAGAVPAQPGEFTKRAFINGKMDLTEAESVASIISATGETAAKSAYTTLSGALYEKISAVLASLMDCSAQMAAWVDYPDEEIDDLSTDSLIDTLTSAKNELTSLLSDYESGQIMTCGIDTAIVGRPNVGKSSLMNLLSGQEKSIVTDMQGTTRDIVESTVRLGSLVLHLSDTAGLRKSDDKVESIGIQRAMDKIQQAMLVLAVFDSSQEFTEEDRKLIELCKGKHAIAVMNKQDLECTAKTQPLKDVFSSIVFLSAKEKTGKEDLEKAIKDLLGVADFDAASPILANERQRRCCKDALSSIAEALSAAEAGMTYDAINVMIDSAVDFLLSLTGKKATEEVVNNIFSKFCVGK